MHTIVPVGVADPKTRLSEILAPAERSVFARAMLADVLDAVESAGGSPVVLTDAPFGTSPEAMAHPPDCPVTVDERPLTPAVSGVVETALNEGDHDAVAVVMADLAIATPAAIERLYTAGWQADVAAAPGRGGGTNALVVGDQAFGFDYHGASFRDHRRAAEAASLEWREVDSFRLATDIDEAPDLAEVLLHGTGQSAAWLRDAGFELAIEAGRVGVNPP